MGQIQKDSRFIDDKKLELILSEMETLLLDKFGLTPLERDIVLRIAQRQEKKMQQASDLNKTLRVSQAAAHQMVKKFMENKGIPE